MDLEVNASDCDGIHVVSCCGELNTYNCGKLRTQIIHIIESGATPLKIICDINDIDYIDSTGLGCLVGSLYRVHNNDGKFFLVTDNPQIIKVFEITGLDKVFTIKPTLEEAIKKMGS